MRILVTGGTGYIGTRLASALVGRGHTVRGPIALLPFYAIGELLPWTRATFRRIGLVTIAQMVRALVYAVESPPPHGTQRIVEVPQIRRARLD